MTQIQFVKYNKALLKPGKREESRNELLNFFNRLQNVNGLAGYMVMDSLTNPQETVVITLWHSKQDMDAFYSKDNKVLSDFVEKSKPDFEQMPERTDYMVNAIKLA